MELISDRLTLILGAPRSGTTWLAKIFDSHPNVLYRHEPDLVVKSDCIPDICSRDQFDQYVDATRRFFLALLDDRSLKSCGSLPVFPKDYEDRIAYATRRGSVYGLRFLQKILPVAFRQFMKVSVGEPSRDIPTYAVIKSISALGRSGLVLRSLPECRIVLILREPFGQVASRLQGFARDKFERQHLKFEWIDTCEARRFGLTESGLRRMTLAQQLAWEWAILNEKAISELGNSPRVRMIRYTDLVDDPHGQTPGPVQVRRAALARGNRAVHQEEHQFQGTRPLLSRLQGLRRDAG